MLEHYATAHVIEDMMYFCAFLVEAKLLSPIEAAEFLREGVLIPSSSVGVFLKKTFTDLVDVLRVAAEFRYSRNFVAREGYQRRNIGFLLERLESFLILQRIRSGLSIESLGHSLAISDSEVVSSTL